MPPPVTDGIREHPAHDGGRDVGEVDEGDQGEVVVGVLEVSEAGAQRGAHPLVPVAGDHDLGARPGDERGGLAPGRPDDDHHAVGRRSRAPGPRPPRLWWGAAVPR